VKNFQGARWKTIYAQKFSLFRKEWLALAAFREYRLRLSAP